jgi:hypothetical protein
MATTGDTVTIHVPKDRPKSGEVTIKWGYCEVNPIAQAIEYFYNQRKKN